MIGNPSFLKNCNKNYNEGIIRRLYAIVKRTWIDKKAAIPANGVLHLVVGLTDAEIAATRSVVDLAAVKKFEMILKGASNAECICKALKNTIEAK